MCRTHSAVVSSRSCLWFGQLQCCNEVAAWEHVVPDTPPGARLVTKGVAPELPACGAFAGEGLLMKIQQQADRQGLGTGGWLTRLLAAVRCGFLGVCSSDGSSLTFFHPPTDWCEGRGQDGFTM